MKDNTYTTGMLQRIATAIQQGHTTVSRLSEHLGVSERQVYRYLQHGRKHGMFHCPVRGIYYPTSKKVVSFEEFAKAQSSNSEDVNLWMSESQQHNTTKQNSDVTLNSLSKTFNQEHSGMSKHMSLEDTVRLILTSADIDYAEFDYHWAVRVMRDAAWWRITEENVMEYILEVGRRYEAQASVGAIRVHAIGYFFGILKRVLSEDVRVVMRSYRQLVTQYGELVAGAESVAASVTSDIQISPAETVSPEFYPDTPNHARTPRSVPVEWHSVQALIREMAVGRSVYLVSDTDIALAINAMEDAEMIPERVEFALQYLQMHDNAGSVYFIGHLRHPNRVVEAVAKNYMRYANYGLEGRSQTASAPLKQDTKDDRYSAFYQLFPD